MMHAMSRHPIPLRPLAIIAFALLMLAGGCALFEKPRARGPSSSLDLGDNFDEVMLVRGTNHLLEQLYVGIVSTSGDAAREATTTSIREDALRWRILWTSRVESIRTLPDPRLRFAALWTFITQGRIALTEGVGKDRFGPVQHLFIELAQITEEQVVRLGYAAFPDHVIDNARPEIEQIARTGGIAGWFDPAELGRRASARGQSPISQILSIPLSPIAGLQGVGDTPTAINNFTAAAREMTRMAERFPERARWELELLMIEAESSGALARTLDELAAMRKESAAIRQQAADLGKTAEGIAGTIDALPAKVGQETREVLKTVDTMQPQLAQTLQQSNALVQSVHAAAGKIETAAQAIQGAASETKALTVELNRPKPQTDKKKNPEDEWTAERIAIAAREIRAAAAEVRSLRADLAGTTSLPAIDQIRTRTDELLWKATRNAAGLILLAFACGILWLLLAHRLRRRT